MITSILDSYNNNPFKSIVVYGIDEKNQSLYDELINICNLLDSIETEESISGKIDELKKGITDNTSIMIGESCGALLLYTLAIKHKDSIKGIFVNIDEDMMYYEDCKVKGRYYLKPLERRDFGDILRDSNRLSNCILEEFLYKIANR